MEASDPARGAGGKAAIGEKSQRTENSGASKEAIQETGKAVKLASTSQGFRGQASRGGSLSEDDAATTGLESSAIDEPQDAAADPDEGVTPQIASETPGLASASALHNININMINIYVLPQTRPYLHPCTAKHGFDCLQGVVPVALMPQSSAAEQQHTSFKRGLLTAAWQVALKRGVQSQTAMSLKMVWRVLLDWQHPCGLPFKNSGSHQQVSRWWLHSLKANWRAFHSDFTQSYNWHAVV